MEHVMNSRGAYTRARRDYRELVFFALLVCALFFKFYFLEYEVSGAVTRMPLSMAASFAIILLFALPVSLFWRRGRFALAILFDLAVTALVVTDLLHIRYYSDLFSFHNIGLSAQVGEISESVFALFSVKDLLYFADVPVLAGYMLFFKKASVRPFFRRITRRRLRVTLVFFCAALALFSYRIYSYNAKVPGVLRAMWDRPAVCNNVGALTYHLVDTKNSLFDAASRKKLSPLEVEAVKAAFGAKNAKEKLPEGVFGAAKGKNLIVIQVESLQSFVIGLKYDGKYVTPHLNAFFREASLASNIYNQTAAGNSSDAEFIANTGLYPSAAGVAYTRFAGNSYRAMPQTLRDSGYSTFGLHGDRAGFWNRGHMYPALGFERFVSRKDFVYDEGIGMGLSDKSFFRQALPMMKAEKKPFYAFLVTLSSHYPFNFPGLVEQSGFDAGPLKGSVVGDYLAAIHYFDTQFGAFIEGLKKDGLYDTSVIVVYGDHNAIPKWDSPNLSKLLVVDLTRDHNWRRVSSVPIIINVPGVKRLKYNKKTALGLAGLPRTLCALLGIDFKSGLGGDYFDMENTDAPVIFRNGSYVTGGVFVQPAKKSAVDLRTGAPLDYGKYDRTTKNAAEMLDVSDKILEYDLMPVIF
ncbi:MAG: LTA synthase family protein [Cloacibacillus sp.]